MRQVQIKTGAARPADIPLCVRLAHGPSDVYPPLRQGEHTPMGLKEVKKGSIAFLMPCGGAVEPRAVQSLLNMVSKAAIDGFPVSFLGVTDRTLIHCASNYLSAGFLEEPTTNG